MTFDREGTDTNNDRRRKTGAAEDENDKVLTEIGTDVVLPHLLPDTETKVSASPSHSQTKKKEKKKKHKRSRKKSGETECVEDDAVVGLVSQESNRSKINTLYSQKLQVAATSSRRLTKKKNPPSTSSNLARERSIRFGGGGGGGGGGSFAKQNQHGGSNNTSSDNLYLEKLQAANRHQSSRRFPSTATRVSKDQSATSDDEQLSLRSITSGDRKSQRELRSLAKMSSSRQYNTSPRRRVPDDEKIGDVTSKKLLSMAEATEAERTDGNDDGIPQYLVEHLTARLQRDDHDGIESTSKEDMTLLSRSSSAASHSQKERLIDEISSGNDGRVSDFDDEYDSMSNYDGNDQSQHGVDTQPQTASVVTDNIDAFVVEDGSERVLAEATIYEDKRLSRRITMGVMVLLLLVMVVVVVVVFARRESPIPVTPVPSMAPSMSPSFSDDGLLSLFKAHSLDNGTALEREGTPQYQAAKWMQSHPPGSLLDGYTNERILQRYALATFYYALNGQSWLNNENWLNMSVDECEDDDGWFFQSETPCTEANGFVVDFLLQHNTLKGSMPPEIGLLTTVETLDLSANEIEGAIPSALGLMESLESLILFSNEFTGAIPPDLSRLTNLLLLALDENDHLQCPLKCDLDTPSELCLPIVSADPAQPTTLLPSEFGLLTGLQVLSLQDTITSAQYQPCLLPTEVGLMTGLEVLNMDGIQIERGSLVTELGLLTKLRRFRLPSAIGSPSLPSELGNLGQLRALDFSGTSITTISGDDDDSVNTIPSEIGRMSSLQELVLPGRVGTFPTEILELTNLRWLDISDGGVNITLTSDWGRLAALETLELQRSGLNGTIPTELGLLQALEYLDLSPWEIRNAAENEVDTTDAALSNLFGKIDQ